MQWPGFPPGAFLVRDGDGQEVQSVLPGSSGGPTNLWAFDCTGDTLTSPDGLLRWNGGGGNITSVATGLPLLPFSDFPCPIAL